MRNEVSENPFRYGEIVTGDSFCNRKDEIRELSKYMLNSENVWFYSPRRYGKSSLIFECISKTRSHAITCYIDLFPTNSEEDYLRELAKKVAMATATTTKRLIDIAKTFFSSLAPSVTIGNDGNPTLKFGVNREGYVAHIAEEILDVPQKIAEKQKRPVVIVLDEFQEVSKYSDKKWQHKIRSYIQKHKNVSYIFAGSQKNMMANFFTKKESPLYNSALHFPLEPIVLEEFAKFIHRKFLKSQKRISGDVIADIYNFSRGSPHYIQYLCNVLWDMTPENSKSDKKKLSHAINILTAREEKLFINIVELLSRLELQVLIALATKETGEKILSMRFLQKHNLSSTSGVRAALIRMDEKGLLEKNGPDYEFTNPVFRYWISKKLSKYED
ncbi:MAG: AAA family ATPase [Candidatus Aminicenantes bacterium]|nr:AAA family ATPase [Candidatus Aminicenantes bacterium]